ncbi:hypothetical protein AGMMS49982_01950 [Bacteroidia bacterium]|nr:hypothetical protein AGMMS49982_01950 [Bacteroidia bacterium]
MIMDKLYLKRKKYYLIISFLLVLCSCTQRDNAPEVSFAFTNNISEELIPIKYEHNGIYFPVILEDSISCDLFLDSGTGELVFDAAFFAENKEILGMDINPFVLYPVYAPYGLKVKYSTVFDSSHKRDSLKLQIGSLLFYDAHPVVFGGKHDYIGIFPMRTLGKEKIVNVNVKEKYIALLDSITNKDDSISFTINPHTTAPIIKMSITINKMDTCYQINGNFLIDLGTRNALLFSESILETELRNIPYDEYIVLSSAIQGFSSEKKTYNSTISFGMGNLSIQNAEITYSAFLPPNITGVVGMDFLEHFNFAVDYNSLLFHYHCLDSVIVKEPFLQNKSGYGLYISKSDANNDIYIVGLLKNGKGDSLGIKLNDKVVKVDDIEVNSTNYEALYDSLANPKPMTIKRKDGSIIQTYIN